MTSTEAPNRHSRRTGVLLVAATLLVASIGAIAVASGTDSDHRGTGAGRPSSGTPDSGSPDSESSAAGVGVSGLEVTAPAAGAPSDAASRAASGAASGTASGTAGFAVDGSAGGFVPGAPRPLPVTVHDPYDFAITVTDVAVTVGAAGPGCPGAELRVDPFGAPLAVAAHSAATRTLSAHLVADAPDACQGATFPLGFHATAVAR